MSSKSQFIEQLKVENGKLKFNKISDLSNCLPNPHKLCRGEAVSSPAGFDEKTAVFNGKKFGLSVPAL